MKRSSFLKMGGLTVGALAFGSRELLAAMGEDPWKIKMLTDQIGVFTEKGGTILFYLSKEGMVVVDTEFPEQAKHLITELNKKSQAGFRLLINTHHHGDHTGGNIEFKGMVPKLVAHDNSLKNQKKVAEAQKSLDNQYLPDKTFTDTHTEKVGDETIRFHYFGAAHTDGDALIHFEKANIVHMGDLINNRRYPYVDRTAGASVRNWVTVLDKTASTFDKDTTFVYGHASEGFEVYGKMPDIRFMQAYFEKLISFTSSEIKAGKSRDEFLKNTSIPGVTEFIGGGIERSLTAAWDELTAV